MAKSIFIPGPSAMRCLMEAIRIKISELTCDFHDHDAYVLAEIKGMMLFSLGGGIVPGGFWDSPTRKLLNRVNKELRSWAVTSGMDPDLYVVALDDED